MGIAKFFILDVELKHIEFTQVLESPDVVHVMTRDWSGHLVKTVIGYCLTLTGGPERSNGKTGPGGLSGVLSGTCD